MSSITHRFITLGLCLGVVAACSSRSQYNNNPPPSNPDPIDSSLVSPVAVPKLNIDGDKTGNGVGSSLNAAEIQKQVSGWNKSTIKWNMSAGNIEIGQSSFDKWIDQYLEYSRVGRVIYGFAPISPSSDAYCNRQSKDGVNPCTSISGVTIYPSFEGQIELPDQSGNIVPVRWGSSLTDAGIMSVSSKDSSLDPQNPEKSTRGREFFQKLYQQLVGTYYSDEPVEDCFAAGRCVYRYFPNQGYYGFTYEAPAGMEGGVYLTVEDDRLYNVFFARPNDLPPVPMLNSEGANYDLMTGTVDLPALGQTIKLGQTFAEFSNIPVPESQYLASASQLFQRFSGFRPFFSKTKVDLLASRDYVKPDANDPLSRIYVDHDLVAPVKFGETMLSLLDSRRSDATAYGRDAHINELEKLQVAAEQTVLKAGGKILVSDIYGEESIATKYAGYGYELIYQLESGEQKDLSTFVFFYGTSLGDAKAFASTRLLTPLEAALLNYQQLESSERVFAYTAVEEGVAPFFVAPGQTLELKDVDFEYLDRATWVTPLGSRRVYVEKDVSIESVRPNKSSILEVVEFKGYKFEVEDTTINFVSCSTLYENDAVPGFCILTVESSNFYEEGRVQSFNDELIALYESDAEADADADASVISSIDDLISNRKALGQLAGTVSTECNGGLEFTLGSKKSTAQDKLLINDEVRVGPEAECRVISSSDAVEKPDVYITNEGLVLLFDGNQNSLVGSIRLF